MCNRGAVGIVSMGGGWRSTGSWWFGSRAFGTKSTRVDLAGTGDGGGYVFSCPEDVFREDAVEGWEEVFVAGEDDVKVRGGGG